MTTESAAIPANAPSGVRAANGEVTRPRTSSRDQAQLRADLTRWIEQQLPAGAAPELGELNVPSGNGMSSETVLFDASWTEAGRAQAASLVARIAPDPAAAPVFQAYYLDRQFRTIKEVEAHTSVPVPNLRWLE